MLKLQWSMWIGRLCCLPVLVGYETPTIVLPRCQYIGEEAWRNYGGAVVLCYAGLVENEVNKSKVAKFCLRCICVMYQIALHFYLKAFFSFCVMISV